MKKVLAATLREVIQFNSKKEVDDYIQKQRSEYRIVNMTTVQDEKIILTIDKSYNNTPLIEDWERKDAK